MKNEYDDFTIDQRRLDYEWQRQVGLHDHWSKQLAEAQRDLDEAEAKFEVVKAEIERAVRFDPKEYGIEKVTESSIASAVVLQKGYLKALRDVNEAKYTVNLLKAAVGTVAHRKAALENLVILWCRDFSSSPKVDNELVGEEAQRRMNDATRREVRTHGRKVGK